MAGQCDDESIIGKCSWSWNIDEMEQAIKDVKKGKLTLRAAALLYNVPRTTLHDRVRGIHAMNSRRGPKPRLREDLERELYKIALEKEDTIRKTEFLAIAGEFAANHGLPFSRGTPSMAWYSKFMVRMKKTLEGEGYRPNT